MDKKPNITLDKVIREECPFCEWIGEDDGQKLCRNIFWPWWGCRENCEIAMELAAKYSIQLPEDFKPQPFDRFDRFVKRKH